MTNPALTLKNLSFTYPGKLGFALENINLEIKEGERFGLFGPNGAGKTTLISLMTGLFTKSAGAIKVFGNELSSKNEIKKLFGFVPQDFAFYPELTPLENLEFFGAWSGLNKKEIKNRSEELLSVFGLSEAGEIPVSKFSGGMKRRVNLAIGVIHNPKIVFLDEPTSGVDVQSRIAIIAYLKKLNIGGTTLIYTSHLLKEAEDLCQHIALIDEGKIIADDRLDSLLNSHKQEGLEGLFLKLTGNAYRD